MMNTTFNQTPAQPPLSHFDKLFSDNPSDVLFCSLNEIEPIFNEIEFLEEKDFLQKQIVDPRNKLPLNQSFYDHTVNLRPEIFRCPIRSTLRYREHSVCLSFLQSIKAKQQIFKHQVECFDKTFLRRQKEQAQFLNFLTQYNNASYEKIYAPDLMFVDFYQKFYKREVQRLMQKHQDGIFQIHTGFPLPQKCGNPESLGTITDIEVVNDGGGSFARLDSDVNLSRMKRRIETYFDLYMNGGTENECKGLEQQVQYNISCEALVFLLSAGEYIDIPSEIIVQVIPGEEEECIFYINEPLPSRNTGPHTAELVASICTDIFFKIKNDESPIEIQATEFNGVYNLQTISDFMSKRNDHAWSSVSTNSCNSQIKWNLNLENDKKRIQILSHTKTAYRDIQRKAQIFYSLKLEYKPQFGCEVISKANLLREWLQLRFSNSPDSSVHRHRINASTFETVLQENLLMEEIEYELERRYRVKIPRLLGSLGDFLSLLSNVGPGRYLLRYNPRFQDKLMLYAETKVSSSKSSVSLHGLLQELPSDLAFMTLRQLTPIDDTLCSAMHDFYKILPCLFSPGWSDAKKMRRIIDDRTFIKKKGQLKLDIKKAKEERYKKKRATVKRIKRKQKLGQKKKQTQENQKETTELEEEIKNDRILFGFE